MVLEQAKFDQFAEAAAWGLRYIALTSEDKSWDRKIEKSGEESWVGDTDKVLAEYIARLVRQAWSASEMQMADEELNNEVTLTNGLAVLYDSLDGSSYRREGAKCYASSIAFLHDLRPVGAFICQPEYNFTIKAMEGQPILRFDYKTYTWVPFRSFPRAVKKVWSDYGEHSPPGYLESVRRISQAFGDATIESMPCVHAGLSTAVGNCHGGASCTLHRHDVAGMDYILSRPEIAGVAEHLDGTPFSYEKSGFLKPSIFAESQKAADQIRIAWAA
jgi:fructose-1,6-bisphosphatase/inositol monophosphatase family enzyme